MPLIFSIKDGGGKITKAKKEKSTEDIRYLTLADPDKKIKYILKMVVCFIFDKMGHYYCFRLDADDVVYMLSDSEVKKLKWSENRDKIIEQGMVYIYERQN